MKKISIMAFLKKHYHAWTFLYLVLYFIWFMLLEERDKASDINIHIIHMPLDDLIPFCEYFVVPYLLWFLYILFIGGWLFFTDRVEFYRFSLFIYTGMQIFLFICTFWPNGQNLRPDLANLGRSNIFIDTVQRMVYGNDTPTNVFPSIHVYNTLGACIALIKTRHISRKNLWIRVVLILQGVLIMLSTVFLKQHSVIDMIGAFVMGFFIYFFAFKIPMKNVKAEL